jgi:hypothetical protein
MIQSRKSTNYFAPAAVNSRQGRSMASGGGFSAWKVQPANLTIFHFEHAGL